MHIFHQVINHYEKSHTAITVNREKAFSFLHQSH